MSEDRTLCMATGPFEACTLAFQDSSGHEELPPGCEDSKGRHFLGYASKNPRETAGCTGLCPAPKDESFFATGPRSSWEHEAVKHLLVPGLLHMKRGVEKVQRMQRRALVSDK